MTVGLALQCGGVSGRGKQRRVNWRKNGRTRTKTNVATYCGHRHTVKRCLQHWGKTKPFRFWDCRAFRIPSQSSTIALVSSTLPLDQSVRRAPIGGGAIVKSLCPRCRKYRGLVVVSPTIGDFSQRFQIANAENPSQPICPAHTHHSQPICHGGARTTFAWETRRGAAGEEVSPVSLRAESVLRKGWGRQQEAL